jgi:hypothetical protein
MPTNKMPHAFYAATITLFCLSLGFVSALKFTKVNKETIADELGIAAAVILALGASASCLSLEEGAIGDRCAKFAKYMLLLGMWVLLLAAISFSFEIL